MEEENQFLDMDAMGLPSSFGFKPVQKKVSSLKNVDLVSTSTKTQEKFESKSLNNVITHSSISNDKSSTTSTTKSQLLNTPSEIIIPIKYQKFIPAHTRSVNAITFNPKASRLLSGGMDYQLRLWDFHSMNRIDQSFKHIEPLEGHSVQALDYSCTGSHFVCAAGDTICRVFDSDVQLVQDTVKGDMYIGDKANTKGHTHMITDCSFHPFTRDRFMSSSMDATIRIWDLNSKPYGVDQSLPHLHCLKAVDKRNMNISSCYVLCCGWSPNGAKSIVGGCVDGSLQLWNEKQNYSKPDKVVRTAHKGEITDITFYSDGLKLLSRSLDDSIKLWDLRKFQSPLHSLDNIITSNSKSSISLSPDDHFIIVPTQGSSKKDPNGSLQIFDACDFNLVKKVNLSTSAIQAIWPKEINQICVGCSDGSVLFLFDNDISSKGALLFYNLDTNSKNEDDLFEFSAPIFTPDMLPDGYKETRSGMIRKVKRKETNNEFNKSIVPNQPTLKDNSGALTTNSLNYTQMLMGNMVNSKVKAEDSADILRSYASQAEKESYFTGKAYQKTQPKIILDYSMEQDEEEELLSNFEKCPRCGLKMCQCGYLNLQKSVYGSNRKIQRTT